MREELDGAQFPRFGAQLRKSWVRQRELWEDEVVVGIFEVECDVGSWLAVDALNGKLRRPGRGQIDIGIVFVWLEG